MSIKHSLSAQGQSCFPVLLFVQGVLPSFLRNPTTSPVLHRYLHTHDAHKLVQAHTHTPLIKIIHENPLNTLPFRIKIPTHELGGRVWLTQTFGAQNFASYFIRRELDRIPHFPSLATTSLSHLQPSFAFCYHGGKRVPAKGHLASRACVCHVDLIPPHCSRTSLLPPPLSSCALQILPVMFHPAQ